MKRLLTITIRAYTSCLSSLQRRRVVFTNDRQVSCVLGYYIRLHCRVFIKSIMVGVVRWPSAGDTAGYRLRRPKLTPVSLILILVPRAYRPQFRVHPQEGEGKGKGVDRRRGGKDV